MAERQTSPIPEARDRIALRPKRGLRRPRDLRLWVLSFIHTDLKDLGRKLMRKAEEGRQRRIENLRSEFSAFCSQSFEYEGIPLWPISSTLPLPSIEDLRRVQEQWRMLLTTLRDQPRNKALRLPIVHLVPVIVKSETTTAVRYRPKQQSDETLPGYPSVVFLFAELADKIRTCDDKECSRLYIAGRIKQRWCSNKCRVRNGVRNLRNQWLRHAQGALRMKAPAQIRRVGL